MRNRMQHPKVKIKVKEMLINLCLNKIISGLEKPEIYSLFIVNHITTTSMGIKSYTAFLS
jgi:hypothetical protein